MTPLSRCTCAGFAAIALELSRLNRGMFISIEGIEGVGKSSNIAHLRTHLEAAGRKVLTTREPGGTPGAERIRELLLHGDDEPIPGIAELLLMFASRSLHVENVIKPALAAGTWVVCDRFTDATRAYQGAGRGLSMDVIDELADWVHSDANPDLTFLLDAPVDIGMARVSQRGKKDRFESELTDFFSRVRAGYLALAKNSPDRFRVIDAAQPLDEVKSQIDQCMATFLANT